MFSQKMHETGILQRGCKKWIFRFVAKNGKGDTASFSKVSVVLEVLHLLLGVGDDGVAAGLPAGGADLAVLVGVLEGLHQPEGLVHGAADGEVVHGDLPEDALVVDDEEAAEGVAVLLEVDAVVLADGVRQVGEEGDVESAEAALLARGIHPRQVREVGVDGAGDDLGRLKKTQLVKCFSSQN